MRRLSLILRVLLLLAFILIFFLLAQHLSVFNRNEIFQLLESTRDSRYAGLIFMAVTTLLSIFFVPISWFVAAGAVLFGFLWGFLYSLTAATLAAMVSFMIASALKGNIPLIIQDRFSDKRVSSHLSAIAEQAQKHSLRLMFTLRNIPLVPFVAVNYLSGMSSIQFRTFFMGSVLGMIPGLMVSTYFFTKVADTRSNPWGALAGIAIKMTYLSIILLWDKKNREKNSV